MIYLNRTNSILVEKITSFINNKPFISVSIINTIIIFCFLSLCDLIKPENIDTIFQFVVIFGLSLLFCLSLLLGAFISFAITSIADDTDSCLFDEYNDKSLSDYKKYNKQTEIIGFSTNDVIIDNISKLIFKNVIDLIFIFIYVSPIVSLFLYFPDVIYFYFYLCIVISGWLIPSLYITTKIINIFNKQY